MQINLSKIDGSVFDLNLSFYNFLKKITQSKLTDNQIHDFLTLLSSDDRDDAEYIQEILYRYVEENVKRKNLSPIVDVIEMITNENVEIFLFSLKLNLIKDLLLKAAKMETEIKLQELEGLHQLSLAFDKKSIQVAYATRISGALLSLSFFEKLEAGDGDFIVKIDESFLRDLSNEFQVLLQKGLEPNQIFMLLFSESINQSITSSAGVSYEERIESVLIEIGIPIENIKKVHDGSDSSTEFDFFFTYKGKTYGIGAKRTLRERYKQFIKTSHMSNIDVMIEITLGTDLREKIAQSIREHDVYLIVADEVYKKSNFLKKMEGVFPASSLSLNMLESLVK